ncbi:hypothetical protein RRG08_063995 [Elysia crispata]|uniref:Uncharacterized protein n=1 Tax=Elysia crispata TaxID=231223 RepID=A0AAE0YGD3_9GAST|nr:hypothetical protein RRG08_063995 [Elysia crispata]
MTKLTAATASHAKDTGISDIYLVNTHASNVLKLGAKLIFPLNERYCPFLWRSEVEGKPSRCPLSPCPVSLPAHPRMYATFLTVDVTTATRLESLKHLLRAAIIPAKDSLTRSPAELVVLLGQPPATSTPARHLDRFINVAVVITTKTASTSTGRHSPREPRPSDTTQLMHFVEEEVRGTMSSRKPTLARVITKTDGAVRPVITGVSTYRFVY